MRDCFKWCLLCAGYAGPTPPRNSGAHNYQVLLLKQDPKDRAITVIIIIDIGFLRNTL